MRVGEVVGSVTLSKKLPEVPDGRLLIVQPLNRDMIRADGTRGADSRGSDPVVAYDELGAADQMRVALSERREASMPFMPANVPIDAYCAALLDDVTVSEDDVIERGETSDG